MLRCRPVASLFLLGALGAGAAGDIVRWDTGELIPGTDGVVPGPGITLADSDLQYAQLNSVNLSEADFKRSNLCRAWMPRSNFDGADFSQANLTEAVFQFSRLSGASLEGAIVVGTNFSHTTEYGLTEAQFRQTAGYRLKDLYRVNLGGNDLAGWDFYEFSLVATDFGASDLSGAVFTNANVEEARFGLARGFTRAQLFSTASYQNRRLPGIVLSGNDWSGLELAGFDLARADLFEANWSGANMEGANLYGVDMYESKVTGGRFAGADLRFSTFQYSDLTDADFSGADLTRGYLLEATLVRTNFHDAIIARADFTRTTSRGFTLEQLYSTKSYQQGELEGIELEGNDIRGWGFADQNLSESNLRDANAVGADFRGARLTYGQLWGTRFSEADLSEADLTSAMLYQADLAGARLEGADFAGALIAAASLARTTARGFTAEQLYSTSSYQRHSLGGVNLSGNDLSGWSFLRQDLRHAGLSASALDRASFEGADLRHAQGFVPAADTVLRNTILPDGTMDFLLLASGSSLAVRNDEAPVRVAGEFAVDAGGELEFFLDGLPFQSALEIAPSVAPRLGGTLRITFDVIAIDDSYNTLLNEPTQLFHWPAPPEADNRFDTIILPPKTRWDLSRLYSGGQIQLLAVVPEPSSLALSALACAMLAAWRRNRRTYPRAT